MFYSVEAEKSVIGTLINNSEWFETVAAEISSGDFYVKTNKEIFSVISALKSQSRPIDLISVKSRLSENLHDDLMSISNEFSAYEDSIDGHISIVKDCSTKRKMQSACAKITQSLSDDASINVDDMLSEAQAEMQKVFESGAGGEETVSTYKNMVHPFLQKMKERQLNPASVSGLASGYKELDELTSGFQPADLIIIAARPSMGKTTLAMNMVENVAKKSNRVMVFSLEMPKDQLMERSVASVGRINSNHIRKGTFSILEEAKLVHAMETLSSMDIVIDDQGGLTINQLRSRAIKAHREKPLSMIMVDYLQLMRVPNSSGNKNNDITEISNGLKRIAKELNIPVVALSQLSRNLESRADKRPINSDLRESGAIEQDADLILFVYRDEIYNPDSEDKGVAEIIIGKQRNGPLGTVKLNFVGHESRFDNMASSHDVPEYENAESSIYDDHI